MVNIDDIYYCVQDGKFDLDVAENSDVVIYWIKDFKGNRERKDNITYLIC